MTCLSAGETELKPSTGDRWGVQVQRERRGWRHMDRQVLACGLLSVLPFRGHYQRVHKVLLEVHAKFKETDFLSRLSNMCLEKRIIYSPPHPRLLCFLTEPKETCAGGLSKRGLCLNLHMHREGNRVEQRCYHMLGFIQALHKAQVDKCAPHRCHSQKSEADSA